MLKGNKGEWGEIYAFCYLLSTGILQAADKDLNPIENIFFPIIKIIREDMSYYPGACQEDTIKVFQGETLLGEYTKEEFTEIISILYSEIPNGDKSFELPDCEAFLNRLNVYRIKADSLHKKDIDIQLHDINTGINPICGFSIKSFLGNNPTLVNAGRNTNFCYRIENCNDQIMDAFNAIETRNKLIDRIRYLNEKNCNIVFADIMSSEQFNTNLKFIDTVMPRILGEALLNYFCSCVGTKKVCEVIDEIAEADPCGLGNKEMYRYKMKLFLCACALGMTPEKEWVGGEDANGGYITVKQDGSVVCYHIYNRTDFYDYLYNYTYFEKGSSSRHQYMSIYKNNEEYYLWLNLQIRFLATL